jgi:hypothetical protein
MDFYKKTCSATLIGAWVLGSSCLNPFAPDLQEGTNQSDLIITDQQTPEEVLLNFRYAYVFRDSLIYSELLDSSFVFFYFDPNIGTSGQFVSWGRDLDLKTTGRLFRRFNVIDLVWNTTISESVQDSTGTGEIIKTFNLTLLTKDEDLRVSGTAVFSFRKSPSLGKWRITKWKDESNL